nr:MAG TPA: tail tape measure [Caudoviricetes sp.]
MALEIFKLVGSIFVDNDEADKSIAKTDEKAQGIGKTLANGAKTVAKWGTAVVTGAAAAVTGVTAFANKTAATCDEIDKMSQKIGISREAYQEMSFITSQCGMDINKLQVGMKTLTKEMDKTRDGTSKQATALEELGINVSDSSGKLRSSEDVMFEVIEKLQSMSNETERARLANELFGKSGSEMAPLLNAGSGAMANMKKQAHDLGLVLDDSVVDSGVALTDTMDQLKRAGTGIFTRLGGVVMPMVQKVANAIIGAMPRIEKGVKTFEPVITKLFDEIVPPLMSMAEKVLPMLADTFNVIMPIITDIVTAVLPVIVQLIEKLLPPVVTIVQKLLPPLLRLLQPVLDLLAPILELLTPIIDLVMAILDPIAELLDGLLTPLIAIVSKLIEGALVPLKQQFTTLSNLLSGTVNAAIALIMNAVDRMKGVFSGLIQFIKGVFTGNWKSAWDGIKKIFANIWEGIKNVFKIPINWIIDGINAFIKGINAIKIPDWVPVVGGKGFNIGTIPRLARGGVLEKGQTGFLEGNGAEAVVPLEKNKKWISSVAKDMDSALGGASGGRVLAVLLDILDAVMGLSEMGVYLDKETLVGGLVEPMDRRLGMIRAQKARA